MNEPAPVQPVLATVEDFLSWAEAQAERYELVAGRLVMMAGGSTAQNDIQVNLLALLRARLRGGPCRPNGSDLAVRIDARTARFPDVSISCGPRGPNYVSDPVVIFEILPESTEADDRGAKWRDYRRLASLRHYVLIAQDAPRLEVWSRQERGWHYEELEGRDAELRLHAPNLILPMVEFYEGVSLAADSAITA
jgi:Uma2 family endonuclease